MTAASKPLLELATDAIIESEHTKFPMQRFVAQGFAKAALDACHAEEMFVILQRLTRPYAGPDNEPLEDVLRDADALLAKISAQSHLKGVLTSNPLGIKYESPKSEPNLRPSTLMNHPST